ncbi:unnamed protein product [Symbiodinium necroappetens]|uniref:Uncharacterized protein n=1 Tax=Symbiodinium necroappetens TaxID=1628268 RepID=A0A813C0C4_9DINO|nr:unnamed protein product [Symbiodinium necroappetens]
MLQEAAPADRWTAKILAYPCFDRHFVEALLRTRLSNLQLVLAMEVDSPGMFAAKAFEWTAKLAPTEHEVFSSRPHMLEQFWVFVKAAMGFGRCEKVPCQRDAKSIAQFQRDLAIRALAAPVLAIAERAGVHASPLSNTDNEILSAEEKARLQLLVFTSGAPSTMANHIRRFEKFEAWARRSSISLYPITNDTILKYAVELDGRECGPTVIPSLRMALEKEVFTQRGKQLKEADPIPIELVMAMEKYVVDENMPNPPRVFIWWTLSMIFASLRFDDAIHVKPHELEVKPEGLFGVSWQTKSERKRRGTKFVVPDVSFSTHSWLKTGLNLFEMSSLSWNEISGYRIWSRGLCGGRLRQTMRDRCSGCSIWSGMQGKTPVPLDRKVTDLTWHSARVTMLGQAVHCKRTVHEIGVQANWKNPGPLILKYTRSRSSLPALMIKDLVSEVSKDYEPECAREDDSIDDPEDRGDCLTEFFIKAPEKGTSYECKFHVCSADSIEEIACKREITSDFVHIGSVLPDPKMLCKLCARARPDVLRSLANVSAHIELVLMVDRTVYPDKDKVPELALRQYMLSVERVAMLGDTITSVKATIKAIVGDDSKFGPDDPARELSLTLLAAVWKSASTLQEHVASRRAKMEEDPSKIPEIPGEDHAEFREIFVNQRPAPGCDPHLHVRSGLYGPRGGRIL